MSGCKMVGFFTVTGSDRKPQRESYTISKAEKLRGHKWRFFAKIEYGKRSATLPLVVDVRWAGDTPVIQVTRMPIPTLGTYTARVLVYEKNYAGFWSGKNYGGQMYGRIGRGDKGTPKVKTGKQEKQTEQPKKRKTKRLPPPAPPSDETWATWRGSDGTAIAGGNPPLEWSEEKNIRWKVAIPGNGHSSPVIWKDRIFVTTAIQTEEEGDAGARPPETRRGGRRGRRGRRPRARPTKVHEFAVLALDRKSGEEVWRTVVARAVPHEAIHSTASQASNSPLTDGEHVWAHFGSRGLFCLDRKGRIVWRKKLGSMQTRNQFGEGSSPALHGNTLVVNWDHEGESFVAAFEKKSGKRLWKKPRDERTSWATPFIVPVGGRPQVIIPATNASRSYDLRTGKLVWSCTGMTGNVIPTPVHADGIVYLLSGFRGAALQAVKLAGAQGDITDSDNVLWTHGRGTPYVPSGLLYDGHLYFLRVSSGVLSCLDAESGRVHYEGQRLEGMRTVYASPVGAAGRVYITSRGGTTKVIKLGGEFEVLASNTLDDGFDASAAIVGDEIYLRGHKNLYCIAEQ